MESCRETFTNKRTERADFEQRKSRFRTEEEQILNRGRADFRQRSNRFRTNRVGLRKGRSYR